MRTTRSTSAAAAGLASHFAPRKPTTAAVATKPDAKAGGTKRVAPPPSAAASPSKSPVKRARTAKVVEPEELPPLLPAAEVRLRTTLPRLPLPFSLQAARAHLEAVDPRFRRLFSHVSLSVYEEAAAGVAVELDLFRTLTSSILGQQVSWLAARSIFYKFCRLFDTSLPEKADYEALSRDQLPFPSPLTVLECTEEHLRTAGLSGAKAKSVLDVARRFADGRLDVRRLTQASEDYCTSELVRARGVGPWTAQMLLMFALRSPNILPVGDLGVQRGMVTFFQAPHDGPGISPKKLRPDAPLDQKLELRTTPPLPAGVTPALLTARQKQKTKQGMYLTPDEMESLTASWAPYRSVGTIFMWTLADS